jgi:hypothetical protein
MKSQLFYKYIHTPQKELNKCEREREREREESGGERNEKE